MNEMNDNVRLAALLDRMRDAAVAAAAGSVLAFNGDAAARLPALQVGCPLRESGDGSRLLLCGEELDCTSFPIGETTIYVLAVPGQDGAAFPSGLLDRAGAVMIDALAPAIAASGLLAESLERDEKATRQLAILRHHQYRLLRVARSLELLGRLNAGEKLIDPALFDLDAFCLEMARLTDGAVHQRGITLCYSSEGAGFDFYGDRELLAGAVLGLTANSAAHCGQGDTIELRLTRRGGSVCLTVTDSGSGISEESYRQIFSPFERGDAPASGQDGLGLSLYLARGVVGRHGGSMAIESEPGKGTRVTILLPVPKGGRELHSSPITYTQSIAARVPEIFAELLTWRDYTPPCL